MVCSRVNFTFLLNVSLMMDDLTRSKHVATKKKAPVVLLYQRFYFIY